MKLAEAGFDIVVLEEGPDIPLKTGHGGHCHKRGLLRERESLMHRLLYQEGAGRTTQDRGILVLQGRCLGGGTAVNWSACRLRARLRPSIQEVVNYLNIHHNVGYNSSACRLIQGCDKLGLTVQESADQYAQMPRMRIMWNGLSL